MINLKSLKNENEISLIVKTLSSYECHEISRLYKHLTRVTRFKIN